ncbi:Transmembrane protein 87A, partial [Stegodyphus mimosarum]
MSTNYFPKIRFYVSKPVRLQCSNRILHLEYINASFVTFSEKLNIPPECENNVNIFTTNPTVTGKMDNASLTLSQEHHFVKPDGVHSDVQKNVNSSNGNMKKTSNYDASNHISSIKKRASQVEINSDIQLIKQPGIKRAQGNSVHAQNSSDPLSNKNSYPYGYISGPFSSTTNVKFGSKLTSVDSDGIYLFILKVKSVPQKNFNMSVDVAMKGEHGYLSAVDFPLLLFYGIMCGLYVIYAIAWLILSALQWRDLLRIQFWIGAVILLGLMEKAVFYAEYQSINYSGHSVQGAILFAEILSCMKRTLARMLIIIVSLGFGIVKPRLGPLLHRIIGVGALYFCLGTIEGCLRVLKPKTDPGNQALMAGIPLAVTDS